VPPSADEIGAWVEGNTPRSTSEDPLANDYCAVSEDLDPGDIQVEQVLEDGTEPPEFREAAE
jgi:hypothetical protein